MQYDGDSAGRDTQDDCAEEVFKINPLGEKTATAGEPTTNPLGEDKATHWGVNNINPLGEDKATHWGVMKHFCWREMNQLC